MHKYLISVSFSLLLFCGSSFAQRADVVLSLNEAVFDAVLDSVFKNFDPPSFPMKASSTSGCDESVKVLREMNGVRTAVRFRDGKIFVPLAFTGNYSVPFVGCTPFSGWAESNVDLEFDREGQRLVGRVRVLNVNLNGTGGLGGTAIARMLQGSIDQKLNPLEIAKLSDLSFGFPITRAGTLRMRAVDLRPEVANGKLDLVVTYEFFKG